jgi:GTP diphosphokinase / guanosine-3',5'-bis(diphosphate) 3'-diphosphatase
MRAGIWPARSAARRMQAAAAPLIAEHRRVFPRADPSLLLRSYEMAERYHRGQLRKSGAPYITHPLAVAELLAAIGMDTTTLAAALLHDTVEDTDLPLGQVKAEFGHEVAILVDGVTKLDGARWGDHAEAETFRKMIMAASLDLRVLVIKLADRVHNMRTLRHHAKREKRERIARATLELLVPLAGRLGLYTFRRELEDLVFAVLEPEQHERLRRLLRTTAPARTAYLGRLESQLSAVLAGAKIRARVEARDRHLYSVYRDWGVRGDDPPGQHGVRGDDLPGLLEVRADGLAGLHGVRVDGRPPGMDGVLRVRNAARIVVLVDGRDADCYVTLGVLHSRWRPVQHRFKDYVAMPKHNMYSSLHTSLLTDDGEAVDVIIRTPAMDEVANYGVAAHIRAAAGRTGQVSADVARNADLKWLDRLLAWQPLSAPKDFLESLRADLEGAGFMVFDSGGSPVVLPSGATGIDFAYLTSPETANRTTGILVNGARKPVEKQLAHGQVVGLITGPPADPPEFWLDAARSGQARAHLRQWFANREAELAMEESEQAAATGRLKLAETLAGRGVDLLDLEADGTAHRECRKLGFEHLDALYGAVAKAEITIDDLLAALLPDPS